MQKSNLKIGEILLYAGKISSEQLETALVEQEGTSKKLGEILVDKGWVTPNDIVEVLEYQLGFPRVDLTRYEVNERLVAILPESIARRHKVVPIDAKDGKLVVAMVDPLNFYAIDDIRLVTKMDIEPVIATESDVDAVIDRYYTGHSAKRVLEEIPGEMFPQDEEVEEQEESEVAAAPIVRLINSLFEQAVRMRASDIHIEPYTDEIRVRFRIDGDLTEIMRLPKYNLSAIVTRIKIIGRMNIAEKRLPKTEESKPR